MAVAYYGRYNIDFPDSREQAELLLLFVLLRRPSERFRALAARRVAELTSAESAASAASAAPAESAGAPAPRRRVAGAAGVGAGLAAGELPLRTRARRSLFRLLTDPPSPNVANVVWASLANATAGADASGGGEARPGASSPSRLGVEELESADMKLLRRPSDAIEFLCSRVAAAAAAEGAREGAGEAARAGAGDAARGAAGEAAATRGAGGAYDESECRDNDELLLERCLRVVPGHTWRTPTPCTSH